MCKFGRTRRNSTPPAMQKFCEPPPLFSVQPPPPKVDQSPQYFSNQIGRSKETWRSPTVADPLGRKTRGKTATSTPKSSWCRKRYFAAISILPKPVERPAPADLL